MTQLIMVNPERLREKTEEQKDTDQTNWVRNVANWLGVTCQSAVIVADCWYSVSSHTDGTDRTAPTLSWTTIAYIV